MIVDERANHNHATKDIPQPEMTGRKAIADVSSSKLVSNTVGYFMEPNDISNPQGQRANQEIQKAIVHRASAVIATCRNIDGIADRGHHDKAVNAKCDQRQQNVLDQSLVGLELANRCTTRLILRGRRRLILGADRLLVLRLGRLLIPRLLGLLMPGLGRLLRLRSRRGLILRCYRLLILRHRRLLVLRRHGLLILRCHRLLVLRLNRLLVPRSRTLTILRLLIRILLIDILLVGSLGIDILIGTSLDCTAPRAYRYIIGERQAAIIAKDHSRSSFMLTLENVCVYYITLLQPCQVL